ncbi:MAG: glutathione S-transferase family protein [Rickettsiales bacterium]
MLEVYHYPLCPFSRKLRIILKEKGIEFELFFEQFWQRRKEFMKMNPAGETPIIVMEGKKVFAGNSSIFEYLEETVANHILVFGTAEEKAEIRRVNEWFDVKFYSEVTRYIMNEKVIKTILREGAPNSEAIRSARQNIYSHLDYIGFLVRNQRYLCGDAPTIADFAAAAQFSVLDFLGDVPWSHNLKAKNWYSLIKSRPSFKPLLLDKVPLITPPSYYGNVDF